MNQFIIVAAFLLTSCGSILAESLNEKNYIGEPPPKDDDKKAPEPKVFRCTEWNDISQTERELMDQGYVVIGESSFRSVYTDYLERAAKWAKKVRADVVTSRFQIAGETTSQRPIVDWIPPSTQTSNVSGTLNGLAGSNTFSGTVTTTTNPTWGQYKTSYVPVSYTWYQHRITYWAKPNRVILGANIDILSREEMKGFGDRGVKVVSVVVDSPAFKADIKQGDVLLAINDEPAKKLKDVFSTLDKKKGKEVNLLLLRGLKEFHEKVVLNVPSFSTLIRRGAK